MIRRVCLLMGILSLVLSACASPIATENRLWIDVPRDGATVAAGKIVEVISHVYLKGGVAEVMLVVNGEPYRRDPPTESGTDFSSVSQSWLPETPGDYTLQVVAYDLKGGIAGQANVFVRVEIPATATPTLTPTLQATSTPTATSTEIPAPSIKFSTDRSSLTPGECTSLRWEVTHATSVTLDGVAVDAVGVRQICPTGDKTYQLSAIGHGGRLDRSVTVKVTAPADHTPPDFGGIGASVSLIKQPPCTPNTVTIRAEVRDPSGLLRVNVVYRVIDGTRQGSQLTVQMNPSGGDNWQATLDWPALEASLSPVVFSSSTLQYSIEATDRAGNQARSSIQSLNIAYCLQ